MAWRAVTLHVGPADAERLSEALLEAGALSVSLEDADAGTPREVAAFGEPAPGDVPLPAAPWACTRLTVLLGEDSDPANVLREVQQACDLDPLPSWTVASVPEDDWVRKTQAQFAPLRIGDRLWIVPSWHAPPADRGAVVLRLDPGMAFGTGTHPTTRLVLGWLELVLAARNDHPRVLDYGCGSGILAIAAAKLGAGEVDAVDIDAQALVACERNAQGNGVRLRTCPPGALSGGSYDLVMANILANPLITLAPTFAACTRSGARVALSGILTEQAAAVASAYEGAFAMQVARESEGWVLLEGHRR